MAAAGCSSSSRLAGSGSSRTESSSRRRSSTSRDRIAQRWRARTARARVPSDYPTDPRFFVDYTDRDGNTVVSAFTVAARTPDESRTRPARRDPPQSTQPFANHNGGEVVFGPDGMLYIAFGDGGSARRSEGQRPEPRHAARQDPAHRRRHRAGRATVHRPARQPVRRPGEASPRSGCTGCATRGGFAFDRATGDLWIGDVGQNAWEEIDVGRAGQGGAELRLERDGGFHCFDPWSGCDQTGLTLPVAEYGHDSAVR